MWCIIINIHVPFSEYTHIYQLSSTSIFFNVIFASVINMCAQEYIMVTEQMFENFTKMLYEFYFFLDFCENEKRLLKKAARRRSCEEIL